MSALARSLGNRILRLVSDRLGCTAAELAEETGATVAEVSSACWALVQRHRLDVCWPYFVTALPPAQDTARAA